MWDYKLKFVKTTLDNVLIERSEVLEMRKDFSKRTYQKGLAEIASILKSIKIKRNK
jgi:hypothetical protein